MSSTRVALYARVSTGMQETDNQLEPLRELAQRRGWVIQGEYVDHGIRGKTTSRPELDRMLSLVARGKVDVVLVWRFDRFARSTQHLVNMLEEFRVRGVAFVSHQENIDTSTPMGKAMFVIVAAMAEFESAIISERVKAGMARAKAGGAVLGRRRAQISRPAVEALRAQGFSVRQVAHELGVSKSVVSARMKEWEEPVR